MRKLFFLLGGALSLSWTTNAISAADFGASYKLVAFSDQPAPGGGTFRYFSLPRIGANGEIGVVGMDYASESAGYHLYLGKPGALKHVVSSGDQVPGQKRGAVFSDLGDPSVSKDGSVGFNAGVSYDGYFRGTFSANSAGVITPWVTPASMDVFSLGNIAFRSGVPFAKGSFSVYEQERSGQALFRGANGELNAALETGVVLDGRRVQEIYGDDEWEGSIGAAVDANESGQIAMKVGVAPSASPTPYPIGAIFAGNPASPQLVAAENGGVPGVADAYFAHLSPRPSVAADGRVAFSAIFSSEAGSRSGIFSGKPGAISAQVLENSAVPTTTNVTFGSLSDAVANSTGDVVFRATIVYPGGATREGIWIKRRTGSPVLLAVSGMTLPTPSGDQEVTQVDFAGPGTFNDLHQVVFLARFGNSEGIYVADTRPVAPWLRAIFPRKPRDRVTRAKSITITGAAIDETGVSEVKYAVAVQDKTGKSRALKNRIVRKAKGDKRWSFTVPLVTGVNRITVTATDKLGNVSEPLILAIRRY